MSTLNLLTFNRRSLSLKKTKLNGRDYIVAPVVMIREGVLNGSQGSILYNRKEVGQRVSRWNHIPITLGHPEDANGNKISARSPNVINRYKIGEIYQTKIVGNKLKALAYFDVETMKEKAPEALRRIQKGKQVELSTGLFTDTVAANGQLAGKRYSQKLIGYEPDHLALLPDEKGACSIEDGCGVNTNSETPTDNALSFNDISMALVRLLRGEDPNTYSYVRDIYPTYFIYNTKDVTYKRGYKVSGDKVSLDGEPTEVVSSTKYRKTSVSKDGMKFEDYVGNADGTLCFADMVDNKKLKKKLTDCKCGGKCTKCKHAKTEPVEVTENAAGITFDNLLTNAGNCGSGSKGRPGFNPSNKCARGSGRAGFGKAKTATKAQKAQAKKRAAKKSGGSSGSKSSGSTAKKTATKKKSNSTSKSSLTKPGTTVTVTSPEGYYAPWRGKVLGPGPTKGTVYVQSPKAKGKKALVKVSKLEPGNAKAQISKTPAKKSSGSKTTPKHLSHLMNGQKVHSDSNSKSAATSEAKKLRAKGINASIVKDPKQPRGKQYIVATPKGSPKSGNVKVTKDSKSGKTIPDIVGSFGKPPSKKTGYKKAAETRIEWPEVQGGSKSKKKYGNSGKSPFGPF